MPQHFAPGHVVSTPAAEGPPGLPAIAHAVIANAVAEFDRSRHFLALARDSEDDLWSSLAGDIANAAAENLVRAIRATEPGLDAVGYPANVRCPRATRGIRHRGRLFLATDDLRDDVYASMSLLELPAVSVVEIDPTTDLESRFAEPEEALRG